MLTAKPLRAISFAFFVLFITSTYLVKGTFQPTGVPQQPYLVKGAFNWNFSNAWHLTPGKENIYFFSNNRGELWQSDGTDIGTKVIWQENFITNLATANNSIFFVQESNSDRRLMQVRENGNVILLKEFNLTTGNRITLSQMTGVQDTLYFLVRETYENSIDYECINTSLWQTNVTTSQTTLVTELNDCNTALGTTLYPLENILIFVEPQESGLRFWRTDSTESGTYVVKEFTTNDQFVAIGNFIDLGGDIYFTSFGDEFFLWHSNGTEAGTHIVTELPGIPRLFTKVNDSFYFTFGTVPYSQQLWVSDGTEQNTRQIKAIGKEISRLENANGLLYFVAENELWLSNGSEESTLLLKQFESIWYFDFVSVGRSVYFRANDGIHGSELWLSRGTENDTQMIADIYPGPDSSVPSELASIINPSVSGKMLFFTADNGDINGEALWALPIPFSNTTYLPVIQRN